MKNAFSHAAAFNGNVNLWVSAEVISIRGIFRGAESFNQDLSSWMITQAVDASYAFYGASSFKYSLSSWSGNVATLPQKDMFRDAIAFQALFVCTSSYDGPAASCASRDSVLSDASFHDAVKHCLSEDPVHGLCVNYGFVTTHFGLMPDWDVSRVTRMSGLSGTNSISYGFRGATIFNGDISKWDTSHVTDMSFMFENALAFNSDISGWVVSRVTDMRGMFKNAASFNQYIGEWQTHQVTTMNAMLSGASAFSHDLSSMSTLNVYDFQDMRVGALAFHEKFLCPDETSGSLSLACRRHIAYRTKRSQKP